MNDEASPIRGADRKEGALIHGDKRPNKPDLWAEFHEKAAELPQELRRTFDLVFGQRLPESKAAEILGVPVRTLRRRCQSALLILLGNHGGADHPEQEWESLNRRRIELIEKECGIGLSEDEQEELERIQKITGRYLNIIAPLPFAWLEQFEERARRAGIPLESEEA
jgi:hypothetical protein